MEHQLAIAMLLAATGINAVNAIWVLTFYNSRDGFRVPWVAYSIALLLMAARRMGNVAEWWFDGATLSAANEMVSFGIDISMLICVAETVRVMRSDAYHAKQLDMTRMRAMIALSHVEALRLNANGVKTERALVQLGEIATRLEHIASGAQDDDDSHGLEAEHDSSSVG